MSGERAQYFASLLRMDNEWGEGERSLVYEVKHGKKTIKKTVLYSEIEQDFLDWFVKMNISRDEFSVAYGFYIQGKQREKESQGPQTVSQVRAGNKLGNEIFENVRRQRMSRPELPLTFYKGEVGPESSLRWIKTLKSSDALSQTLKLAGIELKDLRIGIYDPSFLLQDGVYDTYLFTTNTDFIARASQVVETRLPRTTPVGYAQISVLKGVPTISALQPRFYLPHSADPVLKEYVEGSMKALGLLIEANSKDILKFRNPVTQIRFLTPAYFLSSLKTRESTIQHYYFMVPKELGYSLKALPQAITGGYQHIHFVFEKQISVNMPGKRSGYASSMRSEVREQIGDLKDVQKFQIRFGSHSGFWLEGLLTATAGLAKAFWRARYGQMDQKSGKSVELSIPEPKGLWRMAQSYDPSDFVYTVKVYGLSRFLSPNIDTRPAGFYSASVISNDYLKTLMDYNNGLILDFPDDQVVAVLRQTADHLYQADKTRSSLALFLDHHRAKHSGNILFEQGKKDLIGPRDVIREMKTKLASDPELFQNNEIILKSDHRLDIRGVFVIVREKFKDEASLAASFDSKRTKFSELMDYAAQWRLPLLVFAEKGADLPMAKKILSRFLPEWEEVSPNRYQYQPFWRSEVRKPVPENENNPYIKPGNVLHGFLYEDLQFEGMISKTIDDYLMSGTKPRILVIGAGGGEVIHGLLKNYGRTVDISFINREDIRIPWARYCKYIAWTGPRGAVRAFLDYFHRNVTLHDVDQGLGLYKKGSFHVVMLTRQTLRYIQKKTELLEEILRVLAPKGKAFISQMDYMVFDVFDGKKTVRMKPDEFFKLLRNSNPAYDEYQVFNGHGTEPGLMMSNRSAVRFFPRFQPIRTRPFTSYVFDERTHQKRFVPVSYEATYRVNLRTNPTRRSEVRANEKLQAYQNKLSGISKTATTKTLLVLDDKRIYHEKATNRYGKDYRIVHAWTLEAAIRAVEENSPFDLILSDVDLVPTFAGKIKDGLYSQLSGIFGWPKGYFSLQRGGEHFMNWLDAYFQDHPEKRVGQIVLHSTKFESFSQLFHSEFLRALSWQDLFVIGFLKRAIRLLDRLIVILRNDTLEATHQRIPAFVIIKPKSETLDKLSGTRVDPRTVSKTERPASSTSVRSEMRLISDDIMQRKFSAIDAIYGKVSELRAIARKSVVGIAGQRSFKTKLGTYEATDSSRFPLILSAIGSSTENSGAVLELGSGVGKVALSLAVLNPRIKKIKGIEYEPDFVEISKQALDIAQGDLPGLGLKAFFPDGKVTFERGNFLDDKFSDDFKTADLILYYRFGSDYEDQIASRIINEMKVNARLLIYTDHTNLPFEMLSHHPDFELKTFKGQDRQVVMRFTRKTKTTGTLPLQTGSLEEAIHQLSTSDLAKSSQGKKPTASRAEGPSLSQAPISVAGEIRRDPGLLATGEAVPVRAGVRQGAVNEALELLRRAFATKGIEVLDADKHDSVYEWVKAKTESGEWAKDYTLINFDYHPDDFNGNKELDPGNWAEFLKKEGLIGKYWWVYTNEMFSGSRLTDFKTGDSALLPDSDKSVIITIDMDYFIPIYHPQPTKEELKAKVKAMFDGLIQKNYTIKGVNITTSKDMHIYVSLEKYLRDLLGAGLERLTRSTDELPVVQPETQADARVYEGMLGQICDKGVVERAELRLFTEKAVANLDQTVRELRDVFDGWLPKAIAAEVLGNKKDLTDSYKKLEQIMTRGNLNQTGYDLKAKALFNESLKSLGTAIREKQVKALAPVIFYSAHMKDKVIPFIEVGRTAEHFRATLISANKAELMALMTELAKRHLSNGIQYRLVDGTESNWDKLAGELDNSVFSNDVYKNSYGIFFPDEAFSKRVPAWQRVVRSEVPEEYGIVLLPVLMQYFAAVKTPEISATTLRQALPDLIASAAFRVGQGIAIVAAFLEHIAAAEREISTAA